MWVVALELFLHPRALSVEHVTMTIRLSQYLLPPAMLVISLFAMSSATAYAQQQKFAAQQAASVQEQARKKQEEEALAKVALERKRFTLEVMGLGLAVEKFRQTKLWTEMEVKPKDAYILPEDPKAYPDSFMGKMDVYHKREADALEHALGWFVEKTPIPVFMVGSACHDPGQQPVLERALDGTKNRAGLLFTHFRLVESIYEDGPDRAIGKVFDFFEAHPEVPVVMLFMEDGIFMRHILKQDGAPAILKDGWRTKDDLDDAMVALVLARRDRVEALRSYAKAGNDQSSNLTPFWEKGKAPAAFHETEWLPQPWNKKQIAQFDALPVLGYLHRPQYVSFVKEDGKPLGPQGKEEAFEKAWRAALEGLPEGQKPARIFYDFGRTTEGVRIVPMNQGLRKVHPDFDLSKDGYNLFRSLGDTGASSPYVGLGLGIIASYRKNDISAAVSLRREDGASIFFVSPPTEEDRKKKHPGGPDPLNLKLVPETK
jgi:hypothetical protein